MDSSFVRRFSSASRELCAAALLFAAACAGSSTLAAGRYSAQVPGEERYLQLETAGDGSVVLRNIVSVHSPPGELETHAARLVSRDGKTCLEPAPIAIEACLVSVSEQAVVVKTREGQTLQLERK